MIVLIWTFIDRIEGLHKPIKLDILSIIGRVVFHPFLSFVQILL